MLNFISNLGAYGHNLLAYERNARGANLDPGVNVQIVHMNTALGFLKEN